MFYYVLLSIMIFIVYDERFKYFFIDEANSVNSKTDYKIKISKRD